MLTDHVATLAEWLPVPQRAPARRAVCGRAVLRAVSDSRRRSAWASRVRARAQRAASGALPRAVRERQRADVRLGRRTDARGKGPRPRIMGQFPISEYIARVLDREADATVTHAARALAIVARTWTLENAPFERGCFRVADNSRMQRVSPNAPTAAALAASLFTDGLVLHGESVRYHRDAAAPGVMSWRAAVTQARDGTHVRSDSAPMPFRAPRWGQCPANVNAAAFLMPTRGSRG